jgi:outer membrane protein assembly factor BamB
MIAGGVIIWFRRRNEWSFQEKNLNTLAVGIGWAAVLLLWWLTASRAKRRVRWAVSAGVAVIIALAPICLRIRGVTGDLKPIIGLRWSHPGSLRPPTQPRDVPVTPAVPAASDFPQFLGPNRNAQLDTPVLNPDWAANAPRLIWRQPVGAAWSGWAIVGGRALTQEQRGETECVTCYDAESGHLLWHHGDAAHYQTTIAGEGPRCTPTVISNRVFTLGATGVLNCLDLITGTRIWSRNIVQDAASHIPEWGFAGSPLVYDGKVVVSAGGSAGRSLLAYRADNGELSWSSGDRHASYSSPTLATLSGIRQVLAFNSRKITAHEASSGKVLWEHSWGVGQPQVAVPVAVAANRILFSSGYGVGSELLEVDAVVGDRLVVTRVWQSRKMKAKFSNLFTHEGFLYGLDDGVLACLDLNDGSQKWKEGRYGHGQGLWVRDLLLLMAENGELVLLRPAPAFPNELHRFKVFSSKTWNPIALAGDLLLVRNDQEAAALRLAVEPLRAEGTRSQ